MKTPALLSSSVLANFSSRTNRSLKAATSEETKVATFSTRGGALRVRSLARIKIRYYISLFLALIVLASFSSRPVSAASDELYFLHQDHLGSTRAVTDQDGNVVARFDYWPYGTSYEVGPQGGPTSVEVERLFTSQIKDNSADLYFYNARYYNPALGTFISADPIQGPNRYAYVSNSPINLIDPSGNQGYGVNINDPSTWINIFGLGSRWLANANIPIVSPIFSASARGSEMVIESITQPGFSPVERMSMQVEGLLEQANTAFAIYGAALTGKVGWETARAHNAYYQPARKAARWSYKKVGGHPELEPAMDAYVRGNYDEALSVAEQAWKDADPDFFRGFKFVEMDPKYGGSADGRLNAKLTPSRAASLGIHEADHGISYATGRFTGITEGRGVTIDQHYGLFAEKIMRDEGSAYLAEYAVGGRSLMNAIRQWNFSVSKFTGGFWSGLKAAFFER